jgi:hypothetical protein
MTKGQQNSRLPRLTFRIYLIYCYICQATMPTTTTIKRKSSRISKRRVATVSPKLNRREAKIKKFVDDFYHRYGKMMSKLSHE